MNVDDHIENIEGALDAMATDPDVTSEDYVDACRDIAFRCTAAADASTASLPAQHYAETVVVKP